MPLDNALKIQHIRDVIPKTYLGRQKTVVFVSENGGGGAYTYTAVSVIFRPQSVIDPQIPAVEGGPPRLIYDLLMVAPIGTNFTGVVYVADTSTATSVAVAAAAKYELIEVTPTGILSGGTKYACKMRRFR